MGVRRGSCTAVHLHRLHLGTGGGGERYQEWENFCDVMQGSLCKETKKINWMFHVAFLLLITKSYPQSRMTSSAFARYLLWLPKDRETTLLTYYRLREHWGSMGEWGETTKQLYKHRLVPSLLCLIKDVTVLRNVVIKDCSMISVHSGQRSRTVRTWTLTHFEEKGQFSLYHCFTKFLTVFTKDVLSDVHTHPSAITL